MFYSFFTVWTIYHSGLTESAASDTTSLDFKHNPILCCFYKRNDRSFRVYRISQIHLNLFFYILWHIIIDRVKWIYRSVIFVCDCIQRWYVYTRDFWCFTQKFIAVISAFFLFLVQVKKRIVAYFSLTYIKYVKKISDRFRVIWTWTTAYNYWIRFVPVSWFERDLC